MPKKEAKEDLLTRIERAEKKFKKEKNAVNADSSLGGRLIIDLIAGILVGGFLGYYIDTYFLTLPIFTLILMILGSFGGLYTFYKEMNRK